MSKQQEQDQLALVEDVFGRERARLDGNVYAWRPSKEAQEARERQAVSQIHTVAAEFRRNNGWSAEESPTAPTIAPQPVRDSEPPQARHASSPRVTASAAKRSAGVPRAAPPAGRMLNQTQRRLLAVPCSACGAAVGRACVEETGEMCGQRFSTAFSEPHTAA